MYPERLENNPAINDIGLSGQESYTLQPKIIYDKSLEKPGVPYEVSVDGPGFAGLLQEFGMTSSDIEKLTIVVKRDPKLHFLLPRFGEYREWGRTLTIYPDSFWRDYQRYLNRADAVIGGRRKPKPKEFKEILYTQRLSNYLVTAPAEKGRRTARRFLQQGIQRNLSSVLLHEAKHALDHRSKGRVIWAIRILEVLGGTPLALAGLKVFNDISPNVSAAQTIVAAITIGATLGLVIPYFDPVEVSARQFAKQLKNEPKFRTIITIKPRRWWISL